MANPEHLAILQQGVDAWNEWRKENPEVRPNFKFATFNERDFLGANFKNADFRYANFTDVNFFDANFQNADLQHTEFKECNLSWSVVKRVDLRDAKIHGTNVTCIWFDNNMKCFGINVKDCFGSQRFVRHVMDIDYIEETKERHPFKFFLWWLTSNCGRSIWRWVGISVLMVLFFGFAFAQFSFGPISNAPANQKEYAAYVPTFTCANKAIKNDIFTPYYFSIVTFTTLGFGDVTPTNRAGEIWLALEVMVGYIMLGGLITLFATRMVRQSG